MGYNIHAYSCRQGVVVERILLVTLPSSAARTRVKGIRTNFPFILSMDAIVMRLVLRGSDEVVRFHVI